MTDCFVVVRRKLIEARPRGRFGEVAVEYFSEREGHLVPRDREELSNAARDGIGALIQARVGTDAFAQSFPVRCPRCKESQVINTDETSFWAALKAAAPALGGWPRSLYLDRQLRGEPSTTPFIFDVIEFCWAYIARPRKVDASHLYDDWDTSVFNRQGEHFHIRFNQTAGRGEFVNDVEDVFRRNGVAFTLTESGRVERLLPPEIDAAVTRSEFHTGDDELDRLLSTARTKFVDPKPEVRREAVESLWDAWERLKTIWPGDNKKVQASAMLDSVAGGDSPKLREALEREAHELRWIGNNLRIRHSEVTQEKLATSEHVDYVFQRMFSLIWTILRTQQMVGVGA